MAWSPGHSSPSTPVTCYSLDPTPVNDSAIVSMADSGESGDEILSAVFPTAHDGGLSGVGNPTAIFSVACDGSNLINEKCSATLSVAGIDGLGGVENSSDDVSVGSHSSGSCSIGSFDLAPPACSPGSPDHRAPPGSLIYTCEVAPPRLQPILLIFLWRTSSRI